jgi:aminoglycoside 3-N-acetyltransferase I
MHFSHDALQIKRLHKKDVRIARQLFILLQDVFAVDNKTIAKTSYLKALLDNSSFICFAAIYKDEVIGGLTAYELPMYFSACAEIYIYDIAVKPEFQRMGIGNKLLSAINNHAVQNGIKTVFVDACESDEHALDFYRSTTAAEERVIQFTYNNKGGN